jgi:hypothetical protein
MINKTLQEFVTTKPTLPKILKETVHTEKQELEAWLKW